MMKKIIYLSVFALALVVLAGCNNNDRKARVVGEAAREHARQLQNGNYDRFMDVMVFDTDSPRNIDPQEKAKYVRIMNERIAPIIREKGGIREVNVKSQSISNDGKTGSAVLETVYNNGQKEDMPIDMVRVGNDWKIDMSRHRDVWKTTTADGRDVTITVKTYDDKDVYKETVDGETSFVKVKDEGDRQVVKVKDGDDRTVEKVIEKEDEVKVKEIENGEREVNTIPKQ